MGLFKSGLPFGSIVIALAALAGANASLQGQSPQGQEKPREIVTLIVRPQGMFPKAVTVKPGPVLFLTYNRSGYENVSFELVRTGAQGNSQVRANSLDRNRKAWRETINMVPGTYELRAVGRPGWSCQVNVRP